MGPKIFFVEMCIVFGYFWPVLVTFWFILAGVANLLSILAAAKQGVYSKEYTVRGIPRALARGPSYRSFGIASHGPGNGSAGRRIQVT